QLAWLAKPTLPVLYNFLLDLTGNGRALILLLCVLLIVVPMIAAERSSNPQGILNHWKYPFLLIWLLLPIAVSLVFSLRWPVFSPRFLIPCVVPVVLLAAEGINRMPSRAIGIGALLLLSGFWLNAALSYYRARADVERTDDWRNATRYVLSQAEPGDAVLFTYSEERLAFDE
ncbi:MAG: hypothetical protein JOZ80_10885, partial [Acidobacteriaceae bacterium]|nr:hypothetical protein [Acidobacteriaceae bacterium]